MRKLTLCLAIAAIGTLSASAQDGERIFKRFKGDVSLGYAKPLGSSSSGGALFAMEPKFGVMDNLSIGLRIEVAVMARLNSDNSDLDNAKAAASYVATADYYFTNNYSFRPFVGGGVGVFGIAEVDNSYNSGDDIPTTTKFGGIIRAGAEVKHFRFGVEFNIIPNSTYQYIGNPAPVNVKNSYIGIKVGFCFGGGPR
jgi:opacity protein-like surface antigen